MTSLSRILRFSLFAAVAMVSSAPAYAILYDRGGGFVYDSALNITWLQDANYAKTSGYAADGLMTWAAAASWVDTLNISGVTGWRLPKTFDFGSDGCNWSEPAWGGGGTDCGYSVSPMSSEMANLFHSSLGNNAWNGWPWASNEASGLLNSGMFNNIQTNFYWSDTTYALDQNARWFFSFGTGLQRETPLSGNVTMYAWAVHDGDVSPVPEPGTLPLLFIGLATLAFTLRLRGTSVG